MSISNIVWRSLVARRAALAVMLAGGCLGTMTQGSLRPGQSPRGG